MRLRCGPFPIILVFQALLFLHFPLGLYAEFLPPTQICAPDDNQTCLILSLEAAQELIKGNNPYDDDILVRLTRTAGDEVNATLRSVRITAIRASNGREISPFAFQHPVRLQLGHWFLFERSADSPAAVKNQPFAEVNDVRQWLSVYWSNGQSMIRLDGASLDANQTLSIPVTSLGGYQVNVAQPASSFRLSSGSPYPRILTPYGRYNHRAFFFFENPASVTVTGTIYDFQGSKVRSLQVDGLSPAGNALVWDGRDEGGNVVPSGPYLYKISAGGDSVSGGLAVAR